MYAAASSFSCTPRRQDANDQRLILKPSVAGVSFQLCWDHCLLSKPGETSLGEHLWCHPFPSSLWAAGGCPRTGRAHRLYSLQSRNRWEAWNQRRDLGLLVRNGEGGSLSRASHPPPFPLALKRPLRGTDVHAANVPAQEEVASTHFVKALRSRCLSSRLAMPWSNFQMPALKCSDGEGLGDWHSARGAFGSP